MVFIYQYVYGDIYIIINRAVAQKLCLCVFESYYLKTFFFIL
jgi:hypothetical protein